MTESPNISELIAQAQGTLMGTPMPLETPVPMERTILIGTPAYNAQLHMDWHLSIMRLIFAGLRFKTMLIGNDSLVCRARNNIAAYFLDTPEFSHLLFLDADIGIPENGVKRLLDHDKDVIAASVSQKTDGATTLNYLGHDGNYPAKVKYVGTGAMLISRKALQTVADMSDEYIYSGADKSKPLPVPQRDIFEVGVVDGMYLSEDYYFCHKLTRAGFDIFVDTSIKTVHNGSCRFEV
jgi:hypothetical protein